MWFNRDPFPCSELLRTATEILALEKIPRALRRRRSRTHSPGTVDKYIAALALFIQWCIENGLCPLPASAETVLLYLRYLQDIGHGIPDTLAQLSPIGCWHRTNNYELPRSREISIFCHALRHMHTTQHATPLSTEDVRAMCAAIALESPNRAARDLAMVLICFAAALRPSEARWMRREHLDFRKLGLILTIPTAKCAFNEPKRLTLASAQGDLCPMLALQRWLWLAKIDSGYVFRRIDNKDRVVGTRALGGSTIALIFDRYARRIGIKGRITPYSARRGCATTLLENGATIDQARIHLRHKFPETTQIYVDDRPVPFHQSLTSLILP